ncbi:hypothetical protein [Frondihabitans australicus]|uniref:Uncharacterized protein n=1 Tax=Frondihabitans australicus TaxID=386892 RepID=A0A495IMJ2_9MICO|nr:hypothetical protein [Frondihabitans australicus]RKR76345.1 hypothetical protein C8E83_3514 [Frondihabitans australicus]
MNRDILHDAPGHRIRPDDLELPPTEPVVIEFTRTNFDTFTSPDAGL